MARTAADLDWSQVNRFSASEWPPGVLAQMSPDIILAQAAVRDALPASHVFKPSPVARAHVRDAGTSRHSTQGGTRLSDATDTFIPGGWRQALDAWQEAQRHPGIGGIGFYVSRWLGSPDQITPMIHLDCRPERLLWVCRKHNGVDQYIYLHSDPKLFFEVMGSVF